ncbi:ABC transporter ATP-binding protein [Marinobacter bohaiensis]|uniref:ABC transporter ATP-binding protein n=1 Tax=Marinobacter bohaiensis TaxID=2201898 RepID=UPI000DAE787E|nr:ATP-binding cassette domain-containing protein [Marinobacter bohaiensis]
MTALFELENLTVRAADAVLVDDLSLQLHPGERLTILGETGAGKSVLAQAIMGLLPSALRQSGRVTVDGQDLSGLSARALHRLWGRTLTMLPQEPWHSLDPLMRGRQQVAEVHECVAGEAEEAAAALADKDLAGVGLADDGAKYPFELSGGMAQRVAFCAATAGGARLLLADEPTKGLDATQRDNLAALLNEHADSGGAVLTITHDIDVARQLGGRMIVMRQGQVVETGDADAVLRAPQSDYARELMAASPRHWPESAPPAGDRAAGEPVIRARGLSRQRGGRQLFEGLDLDVRAGDVVGVVGDSGCGKSTLGDTLLGLLPPDAGEVLRVPGIAAHRYQKLFQDPPAAFAPGVPLGVLFDDLIALHRLDASRLPPLMERLRLRPELLQRPASEVSGGELQRLAIARAMLLDPVFLFADEPVSRLDPITSKEIIELLCELAREHDCAVLLVSHDADVVDRVCHRVLRF